MSPLITDFQAQETLSAFHEALSVAAMRVSNEERSRLMIHGCDTAPTPSGFAEIVSDDFQ